MKFELNDFRRNIPEEDLLNDLLRVAEINNKDTVSISEYKQLGTYSYKTIKRRFGSWANSLERAGLKTKAYHKDISDIDLLFEIERLWVELGRQPTTTDVINGLSKYSLKTYCRRFGGWRNALDIFIKHISDYEKTSREEMQNYSMPQEIERETTPRNNTNRDPNYRLRFIILQRDNFKCCACGASPAKDPSVILHIDHIVPWSKGGETVIDNLQTLCSKCNLGKGDME